MFNFNVHILQPVRVKNLLTFDRPNDRLKFKSFSCEIMLHVTLYNMSETSKNDQ